MKRFQNLLAIVTVALIGTSIVSFGLSAVSAAIGVEVLVGLFGYIGIYSGLAMLVTGSIMSIMFFFKITQECFHHADSTATSGMI